MAISTKLAYQGQILKLYPELVKKYTVELCATCVFSALGHEGCDKDLLPVTLEGKPCLYHRKRTPGAIRQEDPRKVFLRRN